MRPRMTCSSRWPPGTPRSAPTDTRVLKQRTQPVEVRRTHERAGQGQHLKYRSGHRHARRLGRPPGPGRCAELAFDAEHLVTALRPHVENSYNAGPSRVDGRARPRSSNNALYVRRSSRPRSRRASRTVTGPAPCDQALREPLELPEATSTGASALRAALARRDSSSAGPSLPRLLPARGYASHGESWRFSLALPPPAFDLLIRRPPRGPVPHPRHVSPTLDAGRMDRLPPLVAEPSQVLVTASASPDESPASSNRRPPTSRSRRRPWPWGIPMRPDPEARPACRRGAG